MRWATLALVTLTAACTDLRDFRGAWAGDRVGESPALRVGPGSHATLRIDAIDAHGLAGGLAIDGLVPETSIESTPGAEADSLANLTFAGAPLHVYLCFVDVPARPDAAAGQALVLVALFDDHRIEVRVIRGGSSPLYAIFALAEGP